jgi:segregation and condensation protein B
MQTHKEEQWIFGAIEAILFVAGEAVSTEELSNALSVTMLEMESYLERMKCEMSEKQRGVELFRFGDKVQLRTNDAYADQVQAALQPLNSKSLSQSVLETLSIVAYKQPITRTEIEQYKGVSADYSLRILSERGLVCSLGRKDTIGRPMLYGTSDNFMRYFGISSLSELPPLPEILEEEITV